jgi:hypothetical protein
MADHASSGSEAEHFAARLIEEAAMIRLSELFAEGHPDALYYLPDRNGVAAVVLRTPALTESQIAKLLKYRFAQYLTAGFFDIEKIYEIRMEHEPPS